ncbi:MAG: replication protein RepA, partial [Immundisolibacterales bacterium]|nr:replication protein RepA [Immundisolibacterales bacterium]
WMARDAAERLVWEPSMRLSDDYYAALAERPVPVDMRHLAKLARSPRRMDLYAWLAYRTARIPAGREVHVPAESLRAVFAPDIAAPRLFRHRLAADLGAVAAVYRDFRVRLEGDRLVLERSRPPVDRDGIAELVPPPRRRGRGK